MTDKEYLDFINSYMKNGGTFTVRDGSVFTFETQHTPFRGIRELIDLIRAYKDGRSCWKCENWGNDWNGEWMKHKPGSFDCTLIVGDGKSK